MNYTIELVNNRPRCKVLTLDRKMFVLKDYELYQLIKDINEDRNYQEQRHNTKNVFLRHSKTDVSVLFKDYEELYEPLYDLYTRFTKKELKSKKINSIKTKAAVGILTSGIISASLLNNLGVTISDINYSNGKVATRQEHLFEPIEVEAKTPEITIENNDTYFVSTKNNVIEEDNYSQPEEIQEPEVINNVNQIQVDIDAVYDKGINDRTNPYLDDIYKYANKRGISPELLYDIVSQEYGGEGTNLMHVIFDSWIDQVITTYNFETNQEERMVLTDHPDDYVNKVDIIITRNDLKNAKTNLAVGTIILRFCLEYYDYNIPLGIQAYNNGVNAVKRILDETSRKTGESVENIIESTDPIWLPYTGVIEKGDKSYFKNVVKHINEDQVDSKVNDVYSVQYYEDGVLQESEAQFKLR